MTARSELFVDETVRDEVQRITGMEDIEVNVPREWQGIWAESEYPDTGEAELRVEVKTTKDDPEASTWVGRTGVRYSKHVRVGTVTWVTRFFVEDHGGGKCVAAEPSKVRVRLDRKTLRAVEKDVI